MTISYQRDVASSTAGGFTRLLFKWKGSLYKLICRELLLFQIVYILLGVIYRQLMSPAQKELFESVVKYFDAFLHLIPLSFVLGFYVSYVASRWWQQFLAIPWPDKLFHSIACYVEGFDEESRMLRRSLMRYMNLALILVLRSISSAVKQRFPTLDHVVEAGFMTTTEKELFSSVPANEFNTYWVPCTWFVYRLQEATKNGRLLNQYSLENIMREFCEFRAKCGLLWCYDWVSIPMVYTQVVTLATYVFFIFTIIGRQKIDGFNVQKPMRSGRIPLDIDLYIPILTVLQFFFYMGLLKVAEQLINPFGDDDEDFELNWLIDRHVKASFLGCDILMNPERIPPMVKDYYWDKQDCPIPYTEASMHFKKKTYRGSADDMKVPEDKCHMVLPEIEEEEEDEGQKLSLTSLLLESSNIVTKIGLGTNSQSQGSLAPSKDGCSDYSGPSPLAYDRSPALGRLHQPGAWRNNGQPAGSARDQLNDRRVSESEAEEDEEERRGSIPFIISRRGSKLADILKYNQEKKKRNKDKRYRDKQGFLWRRMVPDDDLPMSRTPQPHIPGTPRTPPPPQSHTPGTPRTPPAPRAQPQPNSTPILVRNLAKIPKIPSIDTECAESEDLGAPDSSHLMVPEEFPGRDGSVSPGMERSLLLGRDGSLLVGREGSMPPDLHLTPRPRPVRDPDSFSLHSNRSENSFKTCSSEPQLNLIPRQVSDNYNMSTERSAQDRKASVRALKHQYSNLNTNNGVIRPNVMEKRNGR